MSFEARATRVAKDAAKEATKGKGKRGRKQKSAAQEADESEAEAEAEAAQTIEAREIWRALVARMY